jgi:hypothetical protein
MDHVVYLDAKANELENLLNGKKNMIIRGAMGRKLPYGRVNEGDVLYFINNNAEGLIRASGAVSFVFNSEKMSKEDSADLIKKHQDKLQLTKEQFQRWAGKRYIVLIGVDKVKEVSPLPFDKSNYSSMDDWLSVEKIESEKK